MELKEATRIASLFLHAATSDHEEMELTLRDLAYMIDATTFVARKQVDKMIDPSTHAYMDMMTTASRAVCEGLHSLAALSEPKQSEPKQASPIITGDPTAPKPGEEVTFYRLSVYAGRDADGDPVTTSVDFTGVAALQDARTFAELLGTRVYSLEMLQSVDGCCVRTLDCNDDDEWDSIHEVPMDESPRLLAKCKDHALQCPSCGCEDAMERTFYRYEQQLVKSITDTEDDYQCRHCSHFVFDAVIE